MEKKLETNGGKKEKKKGKEKEGKAKRQCIKIGTVWQGPETRRQRKKHGSKGIGKEDKRDLYSLRKDG